MKLHTNLIHVALGAVVMLPACALLGVEPDEIDIAEEGSDETSGQETMTGSATGTGDGDGDGDPATGDGDGDETGDGDPGTGDGDPTGDGDGDGDGDPTGDGDGDPTSGDGDGDTREPCANFLVGELTRGANPVEVMAGPSVVNGSCGSDGPEAVYEFTAPVMGVYGFTLASADFVGALYLVGEVCNPVDELACDLEDIEIQRDMAEGETIHVVVDADTPGQAVVSISGP